MTVPPKLYFKGILKLVEVLWDWILSSGLSCSPLYLATLSMISQPRRFQTPPLPVSLPLAHYRTIESGRTFTYYYPANSEIYLVLEKIVLETHLQSASITLKPCLRSLFLGSRSKPTLLKIWTTWQLDHQAMGHNHRYSFLCFSASFWWEGCCSTVLR